MKGATKKAEKDQQRSNKQSKQLRVTSKKIYPGRVCQMVDDVDKQQTTNTTEVLQVLDEQICMKMSKNSELPGRSHAYDQHLSTVLGDVAETMTTIETDGERREETHKSTRWSVPPMHAPCPGRRHRASCPSTRSWLKWESDLCASTWLLSCTRHLEDKAAHTLTLRNGQGTYSPMEGADL